MRFSGVCALLALAMGASAQTSLPPAVQQSVLLVLATALPADSRSYALASQSAFASEMASSIAAGNTPAWYQALPADVKTLLPALYPAQPVVTPTPTPAPSSVGTISARPTGVNSTSVSSVRMPSLTSSATVKTSGVPVQTGAAAYPSAAIGASFGAALGFLGMLAL